MQREPRAFVEDIIVACDAIAADVVGVDVESYVANRMIRSAVEREFTIIGEAIDYLADIAPGIFVRIVSSRVVTWLDYRSGVVRAVAFGSGRRWLVTPTSDVYELAAWRTQVIWLRGRSHTGIYAADLAPGAACASAAPRAPTTARSWSAPGSSGAVPPMVGGRTSFHADDLESGRRAAFSLRG